jgi:hypothetical protein
MSASTYNLMPGKYDQVTVTRDHQYLRVRLYQTDLIEMDLKRGVILFMTCSLTKETLTRSTVNCLNRFMQLIDDHRGWRITLSCLSLNDKKRRVSIRAGFEKPVAISISGRQMIVTLIKLGIILPSVFERKESGVLKPRDKIPF